MKYFSGRLKVKVTGSNKGQNGLILSLSGPYLVHLCMDFKIICIVVLEEEKCHLNHFFRYVEGQGHRGQIKVKMVIN